MRVEICYATFRRDLQWTDYSLQSFRKYASGFSGVTIVVPDADLDLFLPLEKKFSTPSCPVYIKNFLEFPGKGFLHHEAMICYSDVFMPSATHILHMDPDCMFINPLAPEDYFVDGKPILLIEPYEAIKAHGHMGRYGWKKITETALRFDCKYETMCRHPAVHLRETYRLLRDHMETVHPTPFLDFVLKQQNAFPQGFCEFNSLGAFVVEKTPEKYHLITRGYDDEAADPKRKVEQLWSYTGVETNMKRIKEILA